MLEHTSDALVLYREDIGEYDALLSLYTRDLGKITARATSIRKITSKLNAHVLPGYLTTVRLAAKSATRFSRAHFQLTDALRDRMLTADTTFLTLVKSLTHDLHRDDDLWAYLTAGDLRKETLLAVTGFGGESNCGMCTEKAAPFFYAHDQMFLCERCSVSVPENLLSLI